MVITNPNRIRLHDNAKQCLDRLKQGGVKTECDTYIVNFGAGVMLCLKKISESKWEIFKGKEQTEPTHQKSKMTDDFKKAQYVETLKGWVKGFVLIHLDKRTWRIKHTFNKTKGSRLYAKSYKQTMQYFEKNYN